MIKTLQYNFSSQAQSWHGYGLHNQVNIFFSVIV